MNIQDGDFVAGASVAHDPRRGLWANSWKPTERIPEINIIEFIFVDRLQSLKRCRQILSALACEAIMDRASIDRQRLQKQAFASFVRQDFVVLFGKFFSDTRESREANFCGGAMTSEQTHNDFLDQRLSELERGGGRLTLHPSLAYPKRWREGVFKAPPANAGHQQFGRLWQIEEPVLAANIRDDPLHMP